MAQFRLFLAVAAVLGATFTTQAQAGTYVGTIVLGFYDSSTPLVLQDPVSPPKLGVIRCSTGLPTIITGVLNSAGYYTFSLEAEMGPACGASLYAGGDVDLIVGGDYVATVTPTPVTVSFSSRPVADLVGTLRAGTSAAATLLRSLAGVRDATTAEEAWLSQELSALVLDTD